MKSYSAVKLSLLLTLLLSACSPGGTDSSPQKKDTPPAAPPGALEIIFTYGSEKKAWIDEATAAFNQEHHTTKDGQVIYVTAEAKGSGECMDELLQTDHHVVLTSPASSAFISLGNAESQTKSGQNLIGETQNLVLSPVVIAMWKPMAEALGWGRKPIGWSDILALAKDPRGWASVNQPQWGAFRFGHTHPESSNSGLISLMAEVYAGAGKVRGLTTADLARPEVQDYLGAIEGSVVHYGNSTGFFGDKMIANGPGYLSAAVLYESVVVNSYAKNPALPLVAIYPKEGTFWSDHPVGIVQRPWVTPVHQEAAKIYINYLLGAPIQTKALAYGFRPALPEIPLSAPLDTAHGMDPKEPKTILEDPSADILHATLELWRQKKKNSAITLLFDTSGSMNDDQKIQNAKAGATEFLKLLQDADTFSFIPFSTEMHPAGRNLLLKEHRQGVQDTIDSLYANGATALYDTISTAYDQMLEDQKLHENKIAAIVVLTDGDDTTSRTSLDELLAKIKFDNESHTIRVFTIAYGHDANQKILQHIADVTQAKSFIGTPENIRSVFKEISTFF